MEIFKANLQNFNNRLEFHWVSLVPTVFRRVFRSICVGFLPLEKSPGGFCFQVTLRVRFPKPPWNLFYTKILPVIDYCDPISLIAYGDTNRIPLTTQHAFNFTGIEPGVCLWVGHGVWKLQEPRCAKTERKEVRIRKKVMSRMILTLFSIVGSVMASRKLMEGAVSGPFGVLIPASANAIALSSTVYIYWNVFSGHVNPTVTFAMAVAGRFSVPTVLLYWSSQMVASFMACLVFIVTVVEQHGPINKIAGEMTGFGALVLEGVLAFVLVYTVFTAALNHVPAGMKDASDKKLLVDMLFWALANSPPTHSMLISGDRAFFNALHGLRKRCYNILLAQSPKVTKMRWDLLMVRQVLRGLSESFIRGDLYHNIGFTTLEVCLQNGHMRILAHWLGIYEYKETKETLVANEQSCIRRFKCHGLEPLQTTYNNFLLITVMRKAFRSFIYKMIAFSKYMKRGLNRFYLLPVRLLLESRVTSTSSSKLGFNFLYLFQWLYLNGFMYHVSCKTFMK